MALTQIPYLYGRVGRARQQVPSIGMERNFFDAIRRSIVVLNWFLAANVENFDNFVGATTGNAGSIGVEFDGCDSRIMIMESVDVGL